MAPDDLFTRIIAHELPATIVYQDELVTAFRDINPQAPVHVLIVPNKAIATVDDVEDEDAAMLGRMFVVAKRVAADEGLEHGYRLIVNCKEDGYQEVFHLHMHLLGGRRLGPLLVTPQGGA